MKHTSKNIFLHIIASITFLSIPIFASPDFNSGKSLFEIQGFLVSFTKQLFFLFYFYFNYYVLLPKLFFSGKKVWFFVATLIFLLGLYSLQFIHIPVDFAPIPSEMPNGNLPPKPPKDFGFQFFDRNLFQFAVLFLLSYLLKMTARLEEIKLEKQQAEIAYLKAQINPHFLFNTLNSIYALTLTKSNDAPNAVLKLSGIMRYVTSESSKELVTLDKEINYITDYIALQKLRLNENIALDYAVSGDYNNKLIAPLLLIPYIENAFKYGVNPDESSFVTIKIDIFEKELYLSVKNSIVQVSEIFDEKSQQGLTNTKKRLQILYPNKHQLKIKKDENIYEVELIIFLE